MLKLFGAIINLSISYLSTSAFKLTKSDFDTNLEVSIPIAFFKTAFSAQLDKSKSTLMSPPNGLYGLGKC